MFSKLHLLSQDTPTRDGEHRWRAHPYLRMEGPLPKGPAVFDWSERQRKDLEALWSDPNAEGSRERIARELAAFCEGLGWAPHPQVLEDVERHGEEYLLTVSPVPAELYWLPWEILQVGAQGSYLSDYASTLVRYAVPGLPARAPLEAPAHPGVLFAWSAAGGAVPHEEQAAVIREAARAGGVSFHELAEVDEARLQAALERQPSSVVHLLCHGLPGPQGQPPSLKWGASDNPSEITAPRLSRLLHRFEGSVRLVVLSACGSGDGQVSPLVMSSLAQEVHRKGISNVVASRYPLSMRGSKVMTRALYDKLLREAWSLERALRHSRQTLLRVDEEGRSYPSDAYGLQVYTHDTERFVSDNAVEAERPVLASYPFGTAARPVPASGPPRKQVTLQLAGLLPEGCDVAGHLRRLAEDDSLSVQPDTSQGTALSVNTTVDGAQRLLGVWRSKALQTTLGVVVGQVVASTVILPSLASASPAHAGQSGHAKASIQTAKAAAQQASATLGHTTALMAKTGALMAKTGALMGKLAALTVLGGAVTIAGKGALHHAQREPSAPPPVVQAAPAVTGLPDAVSPPPSGFPPDGAVPALRDAVAASDTPKAQEPAAKRVAPRSTPRRAITSKQVATHAPSLGPTSKEVAPRPTAVKLEDALRAGFFSSILYRSNHFGREGSLETVGFVIPPQPDATGPAETFWSGASKPAQIIVSAKNKTSGAMQRITFRGARLNRCGRHEMNDAVLCQDKMDQNVFELSILEDDNRDVEPGVYAGSFLVEARGWHVKSFSKQLHFDFEVTLKEREKDERPIEGEG